MIPFPYEGIIYVWFRYHSPEQGLGWAAKRRRKNMAIINAASRDGAGKGVARKLRREGRVPAVLYGGGVANVNLSLDAKEWSMLLLKEQSALRTNRQNMIIDGHRRAPVLMRGLQTHPLTGNVTHVDFTRFDPNQQIEINVPVHISGEEECPGIKEGGVMQIVRRELEVNCLAKNVPNSIEVSIAELSIGDSIHIDDIALPEGAEVRRDVNFTVVAIVAVKAEAVVEEEVEAEIVPEETEDTPEKSE